MISGGVLVLLILGGIIDSCLAGGLDWLLPPLRTPYPPQMPPPQAIVSSQTTYTPRIGWGILGGNWSLTQPSGGLITPPYGMAHSKSGQIVPVVVFPPGERLWYFNYPPIYCNLCTPSVAYPGGTFPRGAVIKGCPGYLETILLPIEPATPSTFWLPVPRPQNGSFPRPGLPLNAGGVLVPGTDAPWRANFGGAYSAPATPKHLPAPQPVGFPLYEKPASAVSKPVSRPLPTPATPTEPPPGASATIPQHPPTLEPKLPMLNAPNTPMRPDSGFPAQPTVLPLPNPNPDLDRPSSPKPDKPNVADRAT